MVYAETVDIRFSLGQIQAFEREVSYMREQTIALQNRAAESYGKGKEYLSSVLAWLEDCLQQNSRDYENAKTLELALEKTIWETQKELENRKKQCDALYKAKSDAYNHYDAIKSKARSDVKGSMKMAESVWASYRDAERLYKDAYQEMEECQRRLDALKQGQIDFYWILDRIKKDYTELDEAQELRKRLMSDLESTYNQFVKYSRKAFNTVENVLEQTRTAYKYANSVINDISEMSGRDMDVNEETAFTSIAAVQRIADRMEAVNAYAKELEGEVKRTVANYKELIIDNIMESASMKMREISQKMSRELQANEKKTILMKELAQDLQKYYEVS